MIWTGGEFILGVFWGFFFCLLFDDLMATREEEGRTRVAGRVDILRIFFKSRRLPLGWSQAELLSFGAGGPIVSAPIRSGKSGALRQNGTGANRAA